MSKYAGRIDVGVVTKGGLKVSLDKAAKAIGAFVTGHVKERVRKGKDIHDQKFRPYSKSYQRALRAGGESTEVDLSVTGGFLRSVHVRDWWVGHNGTRLTVIIGPDSGTSPQVKFRRFRTRGGKLTTRKKGGKLFRGQDGVVYKVGPERHVRGRAQRTGGRSPPHNVLGFWFQHGTKHMKPFPWLGVSPDGNKNLKVLMAKLGLIANDL